MVSKSLKQTFNQR